MNTNSQDSPPPTPAWIEGLFAPDLQRHYARWRERKLANYPADLQSIIVAVDDPLKLSQDERRNLLGTVKRMNLALFECRHPERMTPLALRRMGEQLGLRNIDRNLCAEEDGVTALEVRELNRANDYVPYSNRPLSWHTDGYYNDRAEQVRGWILYCVQDAAEGGDNALMDPEIAYILLRDEDPDLVRALMAKDAMTIPANVEAGVTVRRARVGPVFSGDPQSGKLHMRYSARKRNIVWKQDPRISSALRFLATLLRDSPYILRHRLAPGQGIVSNNALHNRSGFKDSAEKRRLYYRARYQDRLANITADG